MPWNPVTEGPLGAKAANPALSVILVPDTNRPSFPAGIGAFVRQTVGPLAFELVIADWEGGVSYRPLVDRVREEPCAPKVTYLRSPRRGRAAMNNLGMSHANAPLLCFCADDFVPGPSYVEAHLA